MVLPIGESMKLPNAWTFSSLEKFETCPKQFYHVRVKKDIKEPPTEAIKWGSEVHEALEHRVIDGTPLPVGMTQWEGLASKLVELPGDKLAEYKMSIDENFEACDWWESWSRGIADLIIVHDSKAINLDYKTGKRKPTEQLELYAAYTFACFPQVKEVETGFVWLKDKRIDKQTYTRDDISKIWQGFLPRVIKLESAYERDKWPAKPSGLCNGWCHVRTCEYYKDKK